MSSGCPILLTSFRPWKAHQIHNSSEVLLSRLDEADQLPVNAVWLSQLPVSFDLAPLRVINQLYVHRPKLVICCGMAEKRSILTLEQQGIHETETLQTPLSLPSLVKDTVNTHISTDAGQFVCNHLYYRVLNHLKQSPLPCQALFVHVPILTAVNWPVIEFDFLRIVNRLNAEL